MRNIVILGSTGSIGTQTLEVVDSLNNEGFDIKVNALTGGKNIELLSQQIKKYKPVIAAVVSQESAKKLSEYVDTEETKIVWGQEGIKEAACYPDAKTVVNAIVGSAGLYPTLAAIDADKNVAIANKETLVCAGETVMARARDRKVTIFPIDSEHSAIFQCLEGNNTKEIRTIYLTASGGPFVHYSKDMLETVKVEDALNHPNWEMGAKITVDSATLMNKGLEVIEACRLFDVSPEQIKVVVHPQSIIHSMVEYCDGSILAQMGAADMRVPIAYALTYPDRIQNNFKKFDIFGDNKLTFEPPRTEDFPCLSLAYEALEAGGGMPAVLSGANEEAVALFLEKKISFMQIPQLIKSAMDAYNAIDNPSIEDIFRADASAREHVVNESRKYTRQG